MAGKEVKHFARLDAFLVSQQLRVIELNQSIKHMQDEISIRRDMIKALRKEKTLEVRVLRKAEADLKASTEV